MVNHSVGLEVENDAVARATKGLRQYVRRKKLVGGGQGNDFSQAAGGRGVLDGVDEPETCFGTRIGDRRYGGQVAFGPSEPVYDGPARIPQFDPAV